MARRIVKPQKTALPVKTIQNVKKTGRHAMGGNLYLTVSKTKSGGLSRRWTFLFRSPVQTVKKGKRQGQPKQCELGFGPVSRITPEEAKERAKEARAMLAKGIDPMLVKGGQAASGVRTFLDDALEFLPIYAARRNLKPSVRSYWEKFIAAHPEVMSKPITAVSESDILATLEGKPDSVKERLFWNFRRILQWSLAQGHVERNVIAYQLPDKMVIAPVDKDRHLAAMPFGDLPAYMARLRDNPSLASLAVQWTILNAFRNSEAREMTWQEITTLPDGIREEPLDDSMVIADIPGSRMKESERHVVPLSRQALAVMGRIPRTGPLMFPAPRVTTKAITPAAVEKLIPRPFTLHGMRSSFADWAHTRGYSIPMIDSALSHKIGGVITRTYIRGTLVAERAPMMQAWGDFLDSATQLACSHVPQA